MTLKSIFLRRLKDRLYAYLSSGQLKEWTWDQIDSFAETIIEENQDKIEEYVKGEKINLENINQSIEHIIKSLLIPSIDVE